MGVLSYPIDPITDISVISRFEALFTPEPSCGCWIWLGAPCGAGYGLFRYQRRYHKPHRLSWAIYRGAVPNGAYVLHRCDFRPCVNPDHLRLGDHDDNMADQVRRGRKDWGEAIGHSKLTEDVVRRLRSEPGVTNKQFAAIFGVNKNTIRNARRGTTWRRVQ